MTEIFQTPNFSELPCYPCMIYVAKALARTMLVTQKTYFYYSAISDQ